MGDNGNIDQKASVELSRSASRRITGSSRVFCVLGHPVRHSVSPPMQNAAIASMGLDAVYVAYEVQPGDLPAAVAGLKALGAAGANCTIPFKEQVIPLLDEMTPQAKLVGAVNTLKWEGGRCTGHNTDMDGFLLDLADEGFDPAGCTALVLGAGGSARAVVAGLLSAGAQVMVANRNPQRAADLVEELLRRQPAAAGRLSTCPLDGPLFTGAMRSATLLVNTTPAGMSPRVEESPPIPVEAMHRQQFVYDLIYNPLETRLLAGARGKGARTACGAGMLARQGALSLEWWTGAPAPADLMKQVILDSLAN